MDAFLEQRPALFGLAYRMLGSVAEAEDILQEAYLRWQSRERAEVNNVRAFLMKTVTRLCLDHLKSARARREHYVGAWLPEPLVLEAAVSDPQELAQDLSVALLLALERLSPLERAVFLLHDVFESDFSEVASLLERSEAACRQLAVRARSNLRKERPRFPLVPSEGEAIAAAFQKASREGDLSALQALLADEVVLHSDGGGRRAAALNPIRGRDRVCRFFLGIKRKGLVAWPLVSRFAWVNGNPGLLTLERDGLPQSLSLEVKEGRVHAIYLVRNPEKLRHVSVSRAFRQAQGLADSMLSRSSSRPG